MIDPVVNPQDMTAFGARNVILSGASARYEVRGFADPLSIKWVRRGLAEWSTPQRRQIVHPDALLVLNDGQEYSIVIESDEPTETFCAFFRRGFVEEAVRARIASHEWLLDAPDERLAHGFFERIHSASSRLGRALARLAAARDEDAPDTALGWHFHDLADALADELRADVRRPLALNAVKLSTRAEIYRRLVRSRDAVEAALSAPWRLEDMAREAAMAPHHFHRSWREAFDETPRDFLSRRRMERAYALLTTTDQSVTDVCFEVGYESLGSFSSAFKKRFGQTPAGISTARRH